MLTIRIENKITQVITDIKSKIRCLFLFGNFNQVKFGRKVRLSGIISFGKDIYIRDHSQLRGRNVNIKDKVFIHENVLIRGAEYVIVGIGTTINRNTCILDKVKIGNYCSIGPNVVIAGSNHIFKNPQKTIKEQGSELKGISIEDDVWIGANATILDGVIIGKGSVIAAGSVVNKSFPPNSVIAGVPAKIIKERGV